MIDLSSFLPFFASRISTSCDACVFAICSIAGLSKGDFGVGVPVHTPICYCILISMFVDLVTI
ncbi:hypothetical protein BDW67DRAFT_164030 [Aspergillus spinulosporus]